MRYLVSHKDCADQEPFFIEADSLEEVKKKLAWHIANTEDYFKEDFEYKIANGAIWGDFVWSCFDEQSGELKCSEEEIKSYTFIELSKSFTKEVAQELFDFYFDDDKESFDDVSDNAILQMSLHRLEEEYYRFTEEHNIKVI